MRRQRSRRRRGLSGAIRLPAHRRAEKTWLEDTGRWFAGPDGKPLRAHGVVRAIDARHAREQRLLELANFDPLTGEINRAQLTEVLSATLDEAVRFRSACGFLLVSIDHLGHLNEAYGFDAAEQVIAKVAKRIRARLRGKDHLGRFSGNKFGVVLTSCTAEEMAVAAERLLAGVRDETIPTAAGPVAATVTIGGVTAPRHARSVPEILSRAQDALHAARASVRAPSPPTARMSSATPCAATTCAPPTRSWPRSTTGASRSPSSRWWRRTAAPSPSTNA